MGCFIRLGAFLALAVAVAGCAANYRTYYANRLDPTVTRGWRVADVVVDVPSTLTVSEVKSLVPEADIVWREDPASGSRYEQVATIMRDAVQRGAAGLRGPRPVVIQVEVSRFHALTFEAERLAANAGVHNIHFTATIRDARTGAVLAGPENILAETPAFSGMAAGAARQRGETQKSVITNHVAATVAGWLGTGPDNRREFRRIGD